MKNLIRVVVLVFAVLLLFVTQVSTSGPDGVRTYNSSGVVIVAIAIAAIVGVGWTWVADRRRV